MTLEIETLGFVPLHLGSGYGDAEWAHGQWKGPAWAEAVVVESLGQTLRAAGFAVPASLGVQEGALVLVGSALGIPQEIALSVAVLRRLRDLIFGLPMLLTWHRHENAPLPRGR